MTIALLSLLIPTAIIHWGLAPRGGVRRQPWAVVFTLGVAMVLAVGVTSCLWFLWLQAFGATGRSYLAIEALVLLAIAHGLQGLDGGEPFDSTRPNGAAPSLRATIAGAPVTRCAAVVLLLLTLTWIASFLGNVSLHPHGSWDAVSIWNLDARFLATGGERWLDFIRHSDACAFHGDYPLLLPSAVARLWAVGGATDPAIGALVAFWFAAATALLCSASVGCTRGTTQALLAAAALLGTSEFIEQSSTQYADIPLAAFMLAAVAAVAHVDDRGGASRRWSLVAGVAAGLAAWTKNEGIMFAVVVLAVRTVASCRRERRSTALGALAHLAAGLIPPLLLLAYFKIVLAPGNDLVAGQTISATVARVFTVSRYVAITVRLGEGLLAMAKGVLVALPIYFIIMGPTRAARGQAGARDAVVVYGLMLVIYCGVYLITPLPLEWHLATSARRVLLQLWPGVLLVFFLRVAAPEECFGRAEEGRASARP